MHNLSAEIKSFAESILGSEFYIEIIKFKTKTYDPYEKKTKNRFELRNALYLFLKDKKHFIFEDALDLRNVPQKIGTQAKDYYSSLSHTEEVGVFVFDCVPIGVDFEHRDKIKKEIVTRVSQKAEMSLSDNYQLLWSIKESAFKSIPFMIQPKTVSEIKVEKITPLVTKKTNPKLAQFSVAMFKASVKKAPSISIEGLCLSNDETQLAIAKTIIK